MRPCGSGFNSQQLLVHSLEESSSRLQQSVAQQSPLCVVRGARFSPPFVLAELSAPDAAMPGAEVPSITAPGGDVPTVGTSAPDVAVDASVPKPDAPKVDASDIPLAAAAAGGLGAVGAAGAGLAAAAADKPKKSGFGRLFSRKGKKSTESAPPVWFFALSCRVLSPVSLSVMLNSSCICHGGGFLVVSE